MTDYFNLQHLTDAKQVDYHNNLNVAVFVHVMLGFIFLINCCL